MIDAGEAKIISDLLAALASAIRKNCEGKRVAVPFSGGVDSSLVAFLLKPFASEVRLYVVGAGKSAPDVEAARGAAELIGIPLKEIIVSEKEVTNAAKEVEIIIKSAGGVPTILQISYELPLYFAAKAAAADSYKFLATGQGADELFGGYARYSTIAPEEFAKSSREDALKLKECGIKVDQAMAAKFGASLFCPFLEEEFFRLALEIPAAMKIKDGIRNLNECDNCLLGKNAGKLKSHSVQKYILRLAAASLGLPESIAQRKKKAAQYGSGIMKVLEKVEFGNRD